MGVSMKASAAVIAIAAAVSPIKVQSKAAMPVSTSVTAPGPQGKLAGTLLDAGAKSPLVMILPGSGPTDRDGNNPGGVSSASYRLLAEALGAQGISTLRTDKRGMFGSAAAIPDPNAVTVGDYAADVESWTASIQTRQKRACVWLLGHSEGGLVALIAAQRQRNACGVILLAAPGRKLDDVLREQLKSNPANIPVLHDAMRALDELGAGRKVDVSAMHPALQSLFNASVQPFLIDMFRNDPAKLTSAVTVPMLIIGGGRDIQVAVSDADALAAANPSAKKIIIADMTHALKAVATDHRAANIATYANPALPVHPELVKAIGMFVKSGSK